MASLFIFLSSLQLLLSLLFMVTTAKSCPRTMSCSRSSTTVRFPFRVTNLVNDLDHDQHCAYPGFDLWCNAEQTIISLPGAGDFSVNSIDYASQTLTVADDDDPDRSCLPRRFLERNFTLAGTPFRVQTLANFTFLNCSSSASDFYYYGRQFEAVPCLSGGGFTVVATPTEHFGFLPSFCGVLGSVPIPVVSSNWLSFDHSWEFYLRAPVRLAWDNPSCGGCELSGKECRLIGGGGLETGCFNSHGKNGLSRRVQIFVYIILSIAIIAFFVSNCRLKRARTRPSHLARVYSRNRNQPLDPIESTQQSQTNNNNNNPNPNPNNVVVSPGLDERVIESYPKSVVGESRRLLSSNDKSCSICLSEYRLKDTLKTLPDCFHYFHSDCIDEWLRLNASCPLCRNSPFVLSPYGQPATR